MSGLMHNAPCEESMINTPKHNWQLKAILCASAIVLAFSTAAVASEGTVIRLKMADFFRLDSDRAWALVYNGSDKAFLFQTSDGGANWAAFPTPFSLRQVFFIDGNNGWAIAAEQDGKTIHTFCVRTSDSGRTWDRLGSLGSSDGTATGIAFDTNEHGWIVGEAYLGAAFVYETTDSGEHWSKLAWDTGPASGLDGVCVHDGIAFTWSAGAGGSGIFELRPSARPERISELETMNFAFVLGDSTLSASQSAVYLRTSANGKWQRVLKAANETFWDMKFVDAAHGCVAGGEMYCTEDGGKTWESRHVPRTSKGESEYIYRLYLLDTLHGWADGNDSIYQTDDGARSWSSVDFFGVADNKPLPHTRRLD
jgi:photosystem II stability/assembly factor-like uncharacterized protein